MTSATSGPDPGQVLQTVRRTRPLVHCLLGAVSAPLVANGLLAAGASPLMTDSLAEAPALTRRADALLINLGMLSAVAAQSIPLCVDEATAHSVPWVLDPAAVGAAPVRTSLAGELLHRAPAVLRANASEVLALGDAGCGGRGADSLADVEDAAGQDVAVELARRHGCAVAVSGPVDLVASPSGHRTRLRVGVPMLARVSGTGCLLGALTAACAITTDPTSAATTATLWLGLAGERAATRAAGPGTFAPHLLDALDAVTATDLDDAVAQRISS